MRLIGTATLADYRQDIERDAAIQRRMQEIVLDEYGTPR
jgi:ATP-dependent Clp protease ATP-binding subunit ClpA